MNTIDRQDLSFELIQAGTFEITREKGVTDNRPSCSLLRFKTIDGCKDESFNVMIDIDHPVKESDDIIHALAEKGLVPEQINAIILTHLHPDHIGHKDLFPNARFIFHKQERFAFYFKDNNRLELEESALFSGFEPMKIGYLPETPDLNTLENRLYLQHCPGHTKGSLVIFACIDGQIHAFVGGIFLNKAYYRNWQPPGMSWDQERIYPQMAFIKTHADIIIPGHGRPFRTEKGKLRSRSLEYETHSVFS